MEEEKKPKKLSEEERMRMVNGFNRFVLDVATEVHDLVLKRVREFAPDERLHWPLYGRVVSHAFNRHYSFSFAKADQENNAAQAKSEREIT